MNPNTLFLSTYFLAGAMAQLLSCSDLGCPQAVNSLNSDCRLGNEAIASVGVATVNTSLNERPLTWTIGLSDVDVETGHLTTYNKEFYLGEPPSLRLKDMSGVAGCAMFFNGISSRLHFTTGRRGREYRNETGTCEDALSADCVRDWTKQVQELVTLASQDGNVLDCQSLAQTVDSSPPPTCPSTSGSWGEVSARVITGASYPAPVALSNCNPTISNDYSITHFLNTNASFQSPSSSDAFEWIYGVTPIITIFAPSDAGSGQNLTGPIITEPETHLTCVKVIRSEYPSTATVLESESGTITVPAIAYVIGLAGVLASCIRAF